VFLSLLRTTPGGLTFRASVLVGEEAFPPLQGPRHAWAVGTAGTTRRQEPPVTRGWRAGTVQLRLPGGGVRLCTHIPRPPPPVPAS